MERAVSSTSELEDRGRTFVHSLRENFGDTLSDGGVIVRPNMDGLGDVTLRVATHDTSKTHNTKAVVDIAREKNMARLAISTVEPTIAGRRASGPAETITSVEVDGATDMLEPSQALAEVESACDRGDFDAYARVT